MSEARCEFQPGPSATDPSWLSHIHGDRSEKVKLLDAHHLVLQRVYAVFVHGLSSVSNPVKPLWVWIIHLVSVVPDHAALPDFTGGSGDGHSFRRHPVVDVIVLSSPAPIVVGKAVDLQVLLFTQ